MNLRPWVQHVRYLSRVVRYLPFLVDHREEPNGVERMDKHFTEVELCGLILRAIPNKWGDAYRIGGDEIIPTNSDRLLMKLEKIETTERNRRRRIKHGGKRIPKKPHTGADQGGTPARQGGDRGGRGTSEERLCALCKKYDGAATTHLTKDCRKWTKDGCKKARFHAGAGQPGRKAGGSADGGKNSWKENFLQLQKDVSKLTKLLRKKSKKSQKRKSDDSNSKSSENK